MRHLLPHEQEQRLPLVTLLAIGLNFGFYVLSWQAENRPDFLYNFGLVPRRFHESMESEFFRIFSSIFLHIDFRHLAVNMIFLWVSSAPMEKRFGGLLLLPFYFLAGIAACLTHVFLAGEETLSYIRPCVGASGVVFAMFGALTLTQPNRRITLLVIPNLKMRFRIQLRVLFVSFILLGMQGMLLYRVYENPDAIANPIAVFAHLGGFFFGVTFGIFLLLLQSNSLRKKELKRAGFLHLDSPDDL